MQFIPVTTRGSTTVHLAAEKAVEAVAGVVDCLGSPVFSKTAIERLNSWLPVSMWSVFRLFDEDQPTMPLAGSYKAHDHSAESWNEYRTTLYKQDETFLGVREQVQNKRQMLVHWHAQEIPAAHRERIYTRHGLRERLSMVCRDKENGILAVNLYRHEELPSFTDSEIDLVGSAAGVLLSCVQKHLSMVAPRVSSDSLLAHLPRREREVCDRMLKGWTYDGIAADLGLSAGTVKTYRDRAFDRLGINHRNQLFALLVQR